MRIITGKYRGRKIDTINEETLRPTTNKTREAVFNIITHNKLFPNLHDDSLNFLEVFSGSAIMSFEAASRGVKNITMLDRNPKLRDLFKRNHDKLDVSENMSFLTHDIKKLPQATQTYNLCFIDPPYNQHLEEKTLISLAENNWLDNEAIIILETDKRNDVNFPENYQLISQKKYGRSKLIFLRFSR